MKYIAIAMLAVSVLAASFIFSTVNAVGNTGIISDAANSETTMNALMIGDIHHLFLLEPVWGNYPIFPRYFLIGIYLDWTALLVTGALMSGIIWLLRSRLNANWLVVGLALVMSSTIPYALGRIALHNNSNLEECGPWTVTMLLGILYPLLACGACTVLELYTNRVQKISV